MCDKYRINFVFLYFKSIIMKTDSLFTFLGGVLVGAAVAILFAPDSGDETRKKIKETFDKEYQSLKDKFNNAKAPEAVSVQQTEDESL